MSRARLKRARRRRHGRRLRTRALVATMLVVPGILLVALAGAVTVAAYEYEQFQEGCNLAAYRPHELGRSSFVYAADDSFLGTIPSTVNRQWVPDGRIGKWAKRATIAIEDRRFRDHGGVDYEAVARAALKNARRGEIVEGASTITQQLVRNLYLSNERTFDRKKEEACLALALDGAWSKERILTTYLNRVFYGNRAYGIEAAAHTYFSRSAVALDVPQAALLAGLIRAPSLYDPFRRPQTALARRNVVIDAMVETGVLSRARGRHAKAQPLGLKRGRLYETRRHLNFFQYVVRQLERVYGKEETRGGGLKVYTTLSPRLQNLARNAARGILDERGDPANAVVSVDPRTGAIRTLVSRAPGRRLDFNLAVQGRRQAGSSFKTMVLAEAVSRGINPYTTVYDSSEFAFVPGPGQKPWTPKTYSGAEYGPSSLFTATLRSDNLVYAKLTLDLGPASVAAMARRLGVRAPVGPYPSIGLGVNEVSPLDMASAYATLAAGGVHREPFAIRKVVLRGGERDTEHFARPEPVRAVSDGVAYRVTKVLEENVQRGTGTAAQIGRPVAGKTGTTDEHTDAWFVGYTPRLATAVWVGYPGKARRMLDVHGIRVTGGSFPAQIWAAYMRPALAKAPVETWAEPKTPVEYEPWKGRLGRTGIRTIVVEPDA